MALKNVLKLILVLVTITSVSSSAWHVYAQGEPFVPDPGVVSFSFRNEFAEDVPGTLDLIKGMGITNIEFSNLFGYTAAELNDLLAKRGMRCTSFGVSYNALVNGIEQVISDAKTLGAKYVRVAWIPFEGEFSIDDAKRAVADFNNAGQLLFDNNLYFCYHNHGYEFKPYQDGTLFDYIVENTSPEFVSFELDLLWAVHPGANPVELLKKYPNRFRLMHLKDLRKGVFGDFTGSTSKENDVVLGKGQVDFPAVLEAAQGSNIEYYYIEDESPDVVERVPRSRAYIISITK